MNKTISQADGDRNNPVTAIKEFNPEFSHQVFGDNETIFGYKDLNVKLYYSAAKLNCYLSINYTDKVRSDETDGIEPDNVVKMIADKFQINFCQSMDEFRGLLSKESQFKPYGQLVDKFSIESIIDEKRVKRHFESYLADISTPGFEAYHQRMQTFLWWFIDAASYIDADDERWQYFLVYEVRSLDSGVTNGHSPKSDIYCFVGYATVIVTMHIPSEYVPEFHSSWFCRPSKEWESGLDYFKQFTTTISKKIRYLTSQSKTRPTTSPELEIMLTQKLSSIGIV